MSDFGKDYLTEEYPHSVDDRAAAVEQRPTFFDFDDPYGDDPMIYLKEGWHGLGSLTELAFISGGSIVGSGTSLQFTSNVEITGSLSIGGDEVTASANEINSMLLLGDVKWSFNASIGASDGFLPFGSDAVSQTGDYADLYAVVGDMFETAYTDLGYAASGAGMFYPAPPPQLFPRAAIPKVAIAAADFDDADDRIDDDDSLTSGVAPFHIHRDGTAVRFSAGDGTLPTGITEGTVYYARKVNSDQAIELYDTEAHAIDDSGTTGRVSDYSSASGTVYMYNAGLYVADAMQQITGWAETDADDRDLGIFDDANFEGALYSSSLMDKKIDGSSTVSGGRGVRDRLSFDSARSSNARTTNESRPENILLYGYIKAKVV